jgi:integrase/recombinase XerD
LRVAEPPPAIGRRPTQASSSNVGNPASPVGLKRQAKILTKGQTEGVLAYLTSTRYPARNRAIFLLSVRAGLRAKEIASLTWLMLTDAEGNIGDAIHLVDEASKGASGRVIRNPPVATACTRGSGRR